MRLALLADIHGNLPALEAVLKELKSDAPDGILVAGDWIAGPWGNDTLEMLSGHLATSILGNMDIRMLEFMDGKAPKNWSTLKQFALTRWNAKHLDERHLGLLRSMPEQRIFQPEGTTAILIVHGSMESPFKGLSNDHHPERINRTFKQLDQAVLVCGHTHFPMVISRNGKTIVNPGAVSGPLNGDVRVQYALLDWRDSHWQAELKAVDYDKTRLIKGFEDSDLLREGGALARCFLETEMTGEDIALLFFEHIDAVARSHGVELDSFVPDDIWEEAENTFDWQAVEQRRQL
jgi:putative phosphoesterase